MRYSADHKAETHEKIVRQAAKLFREHGAAGLGIAGLMKDLSLTNGGFYRHFDSKDDLYVEAFVQAMEERAALTQRIVANVPKGQELRGIIEHYLSPDHVDDAGAGCPVAALAS